MLYIHNVFFPQFCDKKGLLFIHSSFFCNKQIVFGDIRAVHGEDVNLAHSGIDLSNKRLRIGASVHIPDRAALRIVFKTDPVDYIAFHFSSPQTISSVLIHPFSL